MIPSPFELSKILVNRKHDCLCFKGVEYYSFRRCYLVKTVDTYIVKRLVLYRNNTNLSCFKHSIALVDLEKFWGLGVCVKEEGGGVNWFKDTTTW